jgi:hypothetical protein
MRTKRSYASCYDTPTSDVNGRWHASFGRSCPVELTQIDIGACSAGYGTVVTEPPSPSPGAELLPIVQGVPAPYRPGALKAVYHLLGGAGAYLTAWMRRPTQKVDDITDAKSLMIRKVAEAAADSAARDPRLVEAAIEAWLPRELRKQANKQAVVAAALDQLSLAPPSGGKPAGEHRQIDDDWLSTFDRFSEDACSDDMQKLWGRVLSGEIANPGSFRRATLRFLYELDKV